MFLLTEVFVKDCIFIGSEICFFAYVACEAVSHEGFDGSFGDVVNGWGYVDV